MKYLSISLLAVVLLQTTHAHYVWWRMSINNKWQQPLRYIRNVSFFLDDQEHNHGGLTRREWNYPIWLSDPLSDQICGRHHMTYASTTETAKIAAGSKISFAPRYDPPYYSDPNNWINKPKEYWDTCGEDWKEACQGPDWGVSHYGPVMAYLSKAPGDVRTYDGTGDWFKIYEIGWEQNPLGQETGFRWLAQFAPSVNFTIPASTPPGQYLLRIENVYPIYTSDSTQMFVNCAQIEVTGAGGGTPGPTFRLPYSRDDPGMAVSGDMFMLKKVDPTYKIPGPAVWTG